jgi:hypothetical protein
MISSCSPCNIILYPVPTPCLLGFLNSLSTIFFPIVDKDKGFVKWGFNCVCALHYFTCFQAKFTELVGPNVTAEIRSQFNKIINTGSNATKQVIYAVLGGLALILFLLILIIFAAIYWRRTPYVVPLLFILALIILILVGGGVYLYTQSIYNDASTSITANLDNLRIIFNNVASAIGPALCCVGGNSCDSSSCPSSCGPFDPCKLPV